MNTSGHQEVLAEVQETDFGGPPLQEQKRIIYFSSGETLELEEPGEDEAEKRQSKRTVCGDPGGKTRISFKNVAILVGRMSLLACDFLGERLAGALGLNAAKYQYAIDQYHREHKENQTENIHFSPKVDGSHYGATGDVSRPSDVHQSCEDRHKDDGCQNRAYQDDEDNKTYS
ncbi:PREDICTED: protein FAM177A1-like [Cyprinodon variegatus]|uniref:Protein FAM177A1-like n=1 Tax=Cyprinodon variegatus TaxID=28743 RepID=A0A3Q2CK18_CYPVA|nr:PREDICTED: protein FAM177A1-like [Cyprinodon variegatus]